jgi:endo-1,4-beta-xylanase
MIIRRIYTSLCFLILTSAVFAQKDPGQIKLKERYRDFFTIGAAITPMALRSEEKLLIESQFSGITAENAMKMGPIHPEAIRFNWGPADSLVAFASRNHFRMRGHTLVWHSQTPKWLFEGEDGKQVNKEILLQRIQDHIDSVVTRYKGRIYVWDVVNEAISDQSNEFYRSSLFYQICGDEYIEKAFQWAHAADPDALLFYNDYNEIDPVKRKKIIEMVTRLRAKGVPIHGIGLQAHWSIFSPTEQVLENTLEDFSKVGLPLHITELDISVYRKEGRRDRIPSDSLTAYTPEREALQVAMYERVFAAFRKYRSSIRSVTFWNISDRRSWLDNFPVVSRKDHPLLFDAALQPKKAFFSVINF